jgi:transcriptional regulator with XRE-family HTH domain
MIPDLELPATLMIPTCTECGELWIDEDDATQISAAAEKAYRQALLSKAEDAVGILRDAGHPQRDLERLLGISAGYLSKLRAGERDTSAPLVGALMLLAHDPARVAELRNAWSMVRLPGPQVSVSFSRPTLLLSTWATRRGAADRLTVKVGTQFLYAPANEPQLESASGEPAQAA